MCFAVDHLLLSWSKMEQLGWYSLEVWQLVPGKMSWEDDSFCLGPLPIFRGELFNFGGVHVPTPKCEITLTDPQKNIIYWVFVRSVVWYRIEMVTNSQYTMHINQDRQHPELITEVVVTFSLAMFLPCNVLPRMKLHHAWGPKMGISGVKDGVVKFIWVAFHISLGAGCLKTAMNASSKLVFRFNFIFLHLPTILEALTRIHEILPIYLTLFCSSSFGMRCGDPLLRTFHSS